MTPTMRQNGANIDAGTHKQSMQKLVPNKMRKIINTDVKTCKFIGRVIKFEGFARWVREREVHQKAITNYTKSIPKLMKTQCKFHTRKSEANNLENHPKWSPKGSHKSVKIIK